MYLGSMEVCFELVVEILYQLSCILTRQGMVKAHGSGTGRAERREFETNLLTSPTYSFRKVSLTSDIPHELSRKEMTRKEKKSNRRSADHWSSQAVHPDV